MTELVNDYLAAWNDADPESRTTRLKALLDDSVEVLDPDWTASGREAAIDAIGQARAKLGDLRLSLGKVIHTHHESTLFSWLLTDPAGAESAPVATGYGVVRTTEGRITEAQNYFG